MDKQVKDTIDALLMERQAKEAKVLQIREERENKEQAFLGEFLVARKTIVKPAMEEIKDYLAKKSLGAVIYESEQDNTQQSRQSAAITIKFTMNYDRRTDDRGYPHFSVSANTTKQTVTFYESTIAPNHGGQSGSAGECELDKLTHELIQDKIMKILKAII